MTHKEKVLAELESLYDPKFKVPKGLYIPIGYQVLVLECAQEDFKTEGGILLPGGNLQHCKMGVIYRTGELVTDSLKIGFTVAYDKHAAFGVRHLDKVYTVLMEQQIYAVIPPATYMYPHFPDFEEIKRGERIETTKRIHAKSVRDTEKLNNTK